MRDWQIQEPKLHCAGVLGAVIVVCTALPGCSHRVADGGPPPDAAHPEPPIDPPVDAPSGATGPRLIAPLSMASVTQQQPTLRWVVSDDALPSVDLCRDRACTQPLAISTQLADDHRSAVPTAPLPLGWVFWRVRAVHGAQVAISRTWQFWVGAASATTGVDTSGGTVLDINGDGYADFVVATQDGNVAHVYFGVPTASASDWNGVAPAARIDLVAFVPLNSRFGSSMAAVGDVNGDGYADFAIAAPGFVSLYLGSATPADRTWNGVIASLRIDVTGPPGIGVGSVVAAAGDVDGDGFADFVASGAELEPYGDDPIVAVFLGSAHPSAAEWSAATSSRRREISAPTEPMFGFSNFGGAIAGIGDVNRDGFGDLLVGDWLSSAAYVYLGSDALDDMAWNGESASRRLALSNPDGTYSAFGVVVAGAGDVNGDGFSDFLITAASSSAAEQVHLYLGSAAISAATWNQTVSPARIDPVRPDGAFGFGQALAGAGDVNRDGYADFLVGAAQAGTAHLYLGSAAPSTADWSGAAPARRVDLTSPGGSGQRFGVSVASAGDVNGDGYGDFLVGADAQIPNNPAATDGAAFVFLGSAVMDATRWNAASATQRLDLLDPDGAGAHFGSTVAHADDASRHGLARLWPRTRALTCRTQGG